MTTPRNAELDREQRLDEVLAAYLNAVRDGSAPPRQQLLDSHPDLASDLREFFQDQDRFDRLATPLRAAVPAAPPTREFGDYTDLEEIARGGMGVVFRARQKSLNRRVALKMLLAGPLASADDMQRFHREAEAAASLDHPHIVPIYEVNTHNGYPYLSMQLLEGGSLAQAAGRPPWLVEGQASARRVARMLIDVAGAVHHAHQRGILHRDLKPANILLDAAGQAHVSDFGLAKRAQPLAWNVPTAAKGAIATTPLPPALTNTGAILGTPAYMAPEQASGERGAVTIAADVYGLGAILYELLTGEVPFRGLTPLDTLRLVLEQEPVAPSKRNPWVDRDLETICLKCLRKQPGRRYASAEELARDLERYLHGEPIQARPVGALERSWRWCKRQPAVAGLTLALLLTLTAAVTLLTVLWFRAEGHAAHAEKLFQDSKQHELALAAAATRIEEESKEAKRAQADADASFRMAHSLFIDFSKRFVDELKKSPGLQPMQKVVLEATLDYFQKFVEQRGNDPALRRELADTYASIGDITEAIGSPKKAIAARKQALAIYRDLYKRDPNDRSARRELGRMLINLGVVQHGPEKLAIMTEAKETIEQYLQATPDDDGLRSALANLLHNFGAAYGNNHQTREELEYYAQAAAIQMALLQKNPNDDVTQAGLALTCLNLSVDPTNRPDGTAEALCHAHHSQLLYADLARRFPHEPRCQADLLMARNRVGVILRNRGNFAQARALLQDVLAGRTNLALENPDVTRYQVDLAETEVDLGTLYWRDKKYDAARGEYEKYRDIWLQLTKRHPENLFFQERLGVAWFKVSECYGAQKKWPEERPVLEKSRDVLAALVERDPDNLEYRRDLGRTLNNLGLVLGRLDRYNDSVAALDKGVLHSRFAYERAPDNDDYRRILNSNLGTTGEVERFYEHPERAVAATLERRKLWPTNGGELYRIACDLARAVPLAKNDGDRTRYGDLTLEILRQAHAAGFGDRERLLQEKAFDALRQRDDFKQLQDEWEEQPRPNSL